MPRLSPLVIRYPERRGLSARGPIKEESVTTSLKLKKSGTVLAAALALVFAVPASADVRDTITKTFQVEAGGKLTIESDIGSIKVGSAEGDSVRIEVVREAETSSDKKAKDIFNDFVVDFEQRGKDVFVKADYRHDGFGGFWDRVFNRLRVEFIVTVPRVYDTDLRTSGGSISVDNVQGETRSKTSGGSLHFDLIAGNIWGRTSGGSIRIGEVRGEVDVHTSGGGIQIERTKGRILARTSGGSIRIENAGGEVDAHTSGGSITVEEVLGAIKADTSGGSVTATITQQPQSDCSLTTSGGGITVYLAEEIAADLNARSSGGRVTTEFPVTVQGEIRKNEIQAKLNGGGPELYLRTSGGSVHIKKK